MNMDEFTYKNLLLIIDELQDTAYITPMARNPIIDTIRKAYTLSLRDCSVVDVKKIIFNPPATIVFWGDGTKTVVKTMSGESFDMYHGFTAALAKKVYGNSTLVRKIVHKFEDSYYKANAEETNQPVGVGFPFHPSCRCEIKDGNDDAH